MNAKMKTVIFSQKTKTQKGNYRNIYDM